MYNRYIPQPDGTYRRNRIPETDHPTHRPTPSPQQHPQKPKEDCPPPEPELCGSPEETCDSCDQPPVKCPREKKLPQRPMPHHRHPPCPQKQEHCQEYHDNSIGGFLRQLLPKDFDTGDLLIVLLLLLMSSDCAEDKNNALLTLALYLFM